MLLAEKVDCGRLTVIASIDNTLCLFFWCKLFVDTGHRIHQILPAKLIGEILRKFGDTELLIRCIQLGLDGLSHWSFVNRGDLDGQWQYIDTWGLWPKLWLKEAKPHPWCYYVLGLATREPVAIDDGSPIDTSFPGFATLMKGPTN